MVIANEVETVVREHLAVVRRQAVCAGKEACMCARRVRPQRPLEFEPCSSNVSGLEGVKDLGFVRLHGRGFVIHWWLGGGGR